MSSPLIIGVPVVVAVVIIFFVLVYKSLYKKVDADNALVVSGGKRKRAYFGGKIVNPLTCKTQFISLNTMNLKVERSGQEALITKDSLRVDIVAEFFVRIQPNEEDVLAAAASLGEKVTTPQSVSELLEGKLVGALRSVAATMALQELHEQRQEFADAVQAASSEDLKQNGFTLETVSITSLDQTPLEQLDENNRFDATAIQTIKGEVEEKQTLTKKIEAENRVRREEDQLKAQLDIKAKEVETEKQTYHLEQEKAFAEEDKRREIETNKLEQERAVREAEHQQKKAIEQSRIAQEQAVQEAEFSQKQAVEKARVAQEQAVEEVEIQKKLAIETARIEQEEKVQTAQIQQEEHVKTAKIQQERKIKETEAESAILVAIKEKEKELAEIEKLGASAERAKAEELVQTATAVEEANREKEIKVIEAQQKAESEYISKQKAADAEIYKITKTAEAELEAAKMKAESIQILAKAGLEQAKAEAEGEQAMIEAKNTAEQKVFNHEALISFIEQMPEVAEKLMKPAEKIESIRVLDLGGGGREGSSIGRITNSILGAGAAMPVLKEFMDMSGLDVNKLLQKAAEYVPGLNEKAKQVESKKSSEKEEREG